MTERTDKRITFAEYCQFILWLRRPLSYEMWRELHYFADGDGE